MSRLVDPRVRDVLIILGAGSFILASILVPGLPFVLKPLLDFQKSKQKKELKTLSRFNQYRLRQILKRLYKQKIVELVERSEETVLKLTDKGKVKFLKYQLNDMFIDKPPTWDGKWRLIIYDIKKEKRLVGEFFRKFLRKLEILKLQRSVYLSPYPCKDQIEFLRQYYNLGEEVLYLEVNKLENEEAYKDYFKL